MNILGQEQPVIYKMDDMFDPATAQLFLAAQQNYANAVRQDYMQAAQDQKQFFKENRDFYSPFSKDNENYYKLTLGGASKLIDDLRARGIDPLRSIEGRLAIENYIYSRPYEQLANMKMSAKAGLDYIAAAQKLKAEGKYNKDFDDFMAQVEGRPNFDNYDTVAAGKPFVGSPYQYNDLQTDTDNWYKGSEPLYKGMEGGNRVYELNFDDLKNIAQPYIQDYIKTPTGQYRYRNIKERLLKQNPSLTPSELDKKAQEQFQTDVATANIKYLRGKKYESDPFALERYRTQQDLAAYEQKKRIDAAYSGGGGGDGSDAADIFVESDRKANTGAAQYTPKNSYSLRIDPVYLKGVKRINGGFQIPSYNLNNMLTRTVDMTSGKYQKPHFGREDFVKEAEKRTGIPRKDIIAMGTTETGEMATKTWITRDKDGKERQHKVRAVAVKIWAKVPKLNEAGDRGSTVKNRYKRLVDGNGNEIPGTIDYETKVLTNPRTGQPYVRWQIINERDDQYVKPNKKTSTYK